MKTCSKCEIPKNDTDFCKDSKSKDNLQSVCKSCKSKGLNDYYKLHPEKRHKGKYKKSKSYNLKMYYKHRIHYNVSRLVRKGLNGVVKSKPTFDLLGYSVMELKSHLEKQFLDGMNWGNYGEWHIDHKIPRAKLPYDSTNHPNFKLCWSLNNLQPLWAVDNLKKTNNFHGVVV